MKIEWKATMVVLEIPRFQKHPVFKCQANLTLLPSCTNEPFCMATARSTRARSPSDNTCAGFRRVGMAWRATRCRVFTPACNGERFSTLETKTWVEIETALMKHSNAAHRRTLKDKLFHVSQPWHHIPQLGGNENVIAIFAFDTCRVVHGFNGLRNSAIKSNTMGAKPHKPASFKQ